MKILIATGLYPPDIGGPATYTVFLEKYLPRYGIDLLVLPFTHVRQYLPIVRHFIYFVRLIRLSREADVIYALDTISVGVPALLASVCTGKPLLLRVPGDYAWEQGQQRFGITETLDEFRSHGNRPLPVRILSWLQYRVAKYARHIVVPSDYMKTVVVGWGIDSGKITRIYSGLEPLLSRDPEPTQRTQRFVVATAARLVPWKGVSALIEAIQRLRAQGVPCELVVVGDGVCRNDLEKQVVRDHMESYVRFTGSIPKNELGKIITSADAFVLNTSYEGLSHQLLEVMHMGIPIITTPVGGNLELVTDEETGLVVPFNNVEEIMRALIRLYEDRALGVSLAQNAKVKVEAFRESHVIEEFVTLVRSLWK